MARPKELGRRKGSKSKGYFYRSSRGWYVTDDERFVPLRNTVGDHLKDAKTSAEVLRDAYDNWRRERKVTPRYMPAA